MSNNSAAFQDATIVKALIFSNETGENVDIAGNVVQLEYVENIYDDTIFVRYTMNNVAGTVGDKTLLEGLPLVGTEDFELKIKDGSDNEIEVNLNVNNVRIVEKDNQKENLVITFVSEELIRNESEFNAVRIRHDGKISKSVSDILKNNLQTEKELFIDVTSNNFNFIGNKRKPLYMINWLCKKSIPSTDGKMGKTAGYMFYETADGFHFKSIDSLFAQEPVKSYGFFGTPDNPVQYDASIVKFSADNRFDAAKKLRSGVYNTKLILFDPFNCKYDEIKEGVEDGEGTTNAGLNLPVLNEKFNKIPTRTTFMLRDTGVLPTGDVKEQVKKNDEEIFEVANILNQSIRRYSQFSIGSIEIDIFGDFSLHAGDTVFIDAPSTDKDDPKTDKIIGGKYLIHQVKHVIQGGFCQTKLGLVRDSIGRKGKPHNGSTLN